MQPVQVEEFLKEFTICVTEAVEKQGQTRFQITMSYRNKDWAIDKTLAQCNQLFRQLSGCTCDIGMVQERVNLHKVPTEDIKKSLNTILQRLGQRRDVVQLKPWKSFLHLHNFAVLKQDAVLQSSKIKLTSGKSVKDFAYCRETGTLFCLETEEKFTKKVTSLLKSLFTETTEAIGQLSLYLKQELVWSIPFYFKCLCFHWNDKSTMLIVATVRNIQVYRVSIENGYKYQPFNTIPLLQRPQVLSISMSAYNGYIYALNHNSLIVIDINKNKIVEQAKTSSQNTAMVLDQDNHTLYLARFPPVVYIYKIDKDSPMPTIIAHINSERQCKITQLDLSYNRMYLLGGTQDGFTVVFEIQKGREKLSQHISSIETPKESTCISFCQQSKLLFTNYKDNILIINSVNVPVSTIKCQSTVTRMRYYYPEGVIVCGDSEGVITFFQYLAVKQPQQQKVVRKKLSKFQPDNYNSDEEIDGWAQ